MRLRQLLRILARQHREFLLLLLLLCAMPASSSTRVRVQQIVCWLF
jgi:hypothetical protein